MPQWLKYCPKKRPLDSSGIMIERCYAVNLGITSTFGKMWKKTRGWTFKNLKAFGFGKTLELETFVNVEVADYLKGLQKLEDPANHSLILPVNKTFLLPTGTVMYKMMAGPDSGVKIATLNEMNDTTAAFFEAFTITTNIGGAVVFFLPWLRFIFPTWTGRTALLKCRTAMQKESKVNCLYYDYLLPK